MLHISFISTKIITTSKYGACGMLKVYYANNMRLHIFIK